MPVASFLFSEAALVAEFAIDAVFLVGEASDFSFGENFGWGVIDEGGACE